MKPTEPDRTDATRTRLLTMQAELNSVADMSAESARPVTLDQTSVGRLSRMDALQVQALAQATLDRRTAQLKAIDAALRRLDIGEYGVCEHCDEAINPQRLAIDPVATLCIHCAERFSSDA